MEPFMPVECLRKKVIPSKVLPILYNLFVYQCQASSREKATKFTSILYMVQLFAGCKKKKKHSHLKGNFYQNFRINSTRINQ